MAFPNENVDINSLYYEGYYNNILLSVTIELLTECNWRCKHCYIPQHDNYGMTKEVIFKLFKDLRNMGTMNITFTGGEIFLRKDIFEIIEKARDMHFRVYLFSNASLLNEEIIRRLSELYISQYSMTVFSLEAEIHDFITGIKGSLEKTLSNIELLQKYKIPLEIKTPLMDVNKFSFIHLKEFCDKRNITYGATTNIFSKSDGDQSPKELSIAEDDLVKVLKELNKIEDNSRILGEETTNECCPLLKFILSIDSNGDVFPCKSLYYKVGNVLEQSVNDIWNFSTDLKNVKNMTKECLDECNKCDLLEFCHHCPGSALLENEAMNRCDLLARRNAKAQKILLNMKN